MMMSPPEIPSFFAFCIRRVSELGMTPGLASHRACGAEQFSRTNSFTPVAGSGRSAPAATDAAQQNRKAPRMRLNKTEKRPGPESGTLGNLIRRPAGG
jgi:hypothetical protein